MRMQDIKVGEEYAWGSSRERCVIVDKDVHLPQYAFRGVMIAFGSGPFKRVPAREIVCTWAEQLEENERQLAELERKRQERVPYEEAAEDLRNTFRDLNILGSVKARQSWITVTIDRPAIAKTIATALRKNWGA